MSVTETAQAATAIAVDGGKAVTISASDSTTGTIVVGGTTAAAGAVSVTRSGNYTDNNTGGTDTGTLTVEVKDPYTIYVAPTYVVGNNSALYAKLGYSKADLNVNATGGAALTTKPSDLEGWTYAIGSKTLLTNNVYFGVEASVTDYDSIKATRATGVNISADAKVAQGTITLGYKF